MTLLGWDDSGRKRALREVLFYCSLVSSADQTERPCHASLCGMPLSFTGWLSHSMHPSATGRSSFWICQHSLEDIPWGERSRAFSVSLVQQFGLSGATCSIQNGAWYAGDSDRSMPSAQLQTTRDRQLKTAGLACRDHPQPLQKMHNKTFCSMSLRAEHFPVLPEQRQKNLLFLFKLPCKTFKEAK